MNDSIPCSEEGCMYNKMGYCKYMDAPIKQPYYQACKDEFDNGDYE